MRLIGGIPVPCTMADVEKKVVQDLTTKDRVRYLRVKLDAIQLFCIVSHRSARTFVSDSQDAEPFRYSTDKVRMAHPTDAFLGNVFEQVVFLYRDQRFAILTAMLGVAYHSTAHVRKKLGTIADAQDRDPQIQDLRIVMW